MYTIGMNEQSDIVASTEPSPKPQGYGEGPSISTIPSHADQPSHATDGMSSAGFNAHTDPEYKQAVIQTLTVYTILAIGAVVFFPWLDRTLNNPVSPGWITFWGTGLALSTLTAAFVHLALRRLLSLSKMAVVMTITYLILIVVMKFTMGPLALYTANPVFENGLLGSINANPIMASLIAGAIFLLYLLVFSVLRKLALGKLRKAFGYDKTKVKSKKAVAGLIILAVVLLALGTGGGILLVPLIFFGSMVGYLSYVFSGVYALVVAVTAVITVVVCREAMNIQVEEAIARQNPALFVAYAWTALAIIAIFHAAWVIYWLVLTAIWPFKTVTPK